MGAPGSAGTRGEQGPAGPRGLQGIQGAPGDDGSRYAYVHADGGVADSRSQGINDAMVRRVENDDGGSFYCFYLIGDVSNVSITQAAGLFGSFPLIGRVGLGVGCPTAGLLGDADFDVFWVDDVGASLGDLQASDFYVVVR